MAMMASPALILIFAAGLALEQDERTGVKGKEYHLDMKPNSVDDQYKGCAENMTNLVKNTFLQKELNNQEFGEAWKRANDSCGNPGHGLTINQCIALFVYSDSNKTQIYKVFNEAGRDGKEEYKSRTFKWYSLQFFLTEAVQALKREQKNSKTTFRGTNVSFLKKVVNHEIRFGQFASSSTEKKTAQGFGTKSCFEINSDQGVAIKDFSTIPGENEVLIPPYEKFKVTEVLEKVNDPNLWCETVYKLQSTGIQSNLNCAVASGRSLIYHRYRFLWVACVCVITFIHSL
ncbi:erythroblast NAD(P)(+)--arginine ADP-ribosyltransferase-like [Alosa pseudoharengus]|uniref:erythroblast NAD(P)(+)--arginine ADP-ribosyltransferase-like n=1 Tax=Alosa pseudoharengus TaxID=34774 RepID=UPI003F88621D